VEGLTLSLVSLLVAVVSAFVFAGTETAITGMGELRIRKLIETGKGPRRWLELWLEDPSRILTTLLAGNTLANIIASAVMTSLALRTAATYGLDSHWVEIAGIGLLTAVLLIGGEIAPKTMAKHHPESFLPLMHVAWWFHVATHWMTAAMMWAAMQVVRGLGGTAKPAAFQVTEEQIEDLVRIGSEAGSIDQGRGDILQNVFDLGELTARSIMTPRIQIDGVPEGASYDEVAQIVQTHGFSRYPVYDKTIDKIVGVFHAKDLMAYAIGGRQGTFKLDDHIRDAKFVPETKKAIELLKELQQGKGHMAVVVDEHGGTAGIVTMEDLLEELVGEIYDEYDQPEQVVASVGPHGWHVEASADIRDLNDEYEVDLPETTAYSTVGGFLVDQMGRVPTVGEEWRWQDLTFRVLEADETRVVRLELQRDPPADEEFAAGNGGRPKTGPELRPIAPH
jgi:CBS domain containing-hemolysin-like protein